MTPPVAIAELYRQLPAVEPGRDGQAHARTTSGVPAGLNTGARGVVQPSPDSAATPPSRLPGGRAGVYSSHVEALRFGEVLRSKKTQQRRGGQTPGQVAGGLAAQGATETEVRAGLLRHFGPWMTDGEIERIAAYVSRREAQKTAPLRAELDRLDAALEDTRMCGYAFLKKYRYRPLHLQRLGESGWAVLLALIAWERWYVSRTQKIANPEFPYGPTLRVSAYSLQRVLVELHAAGIIPRVWTRRTVGRALHRLAKLGHIMYRAGLNLRETMEMLRNSEIKGRSLILTNTRFRVASEVSLDTLDGAALLHAKRDFDLRVSACLQVMEELRVPGLVRRYRGLLSDFYRRMFAPAKQANSASERRRRYEETHREARRLRDSQRAARRREYWTRYKAAQRQRRKAANLSTVDSQTEKECVRSYAGR